MSENNLVKSGSYEDVSRDDIVAIKVADLETKLMQVDAVLTEDIVKTRSELDRLNKNRSMILLEEAKKKYQKKLEAIAAAITDLDGEKLEIRYNVGAVPECDLETELEESENVGVSTTKDDTYKVTVSIITAAKKKHYNESVYDTEVKLQIPKSLKENFKAAKEAKQKLEELVAKQSKCRTAQSRMGVVERQCKAALATQRLKEIGRADLLKTLDSVEIPGMKLQKLLGQ